MCQARIKAGSFKLPVTDVEVSFTKVCGAEPKRSVTTDDGDAKFSICTACTNHYLTKHQEDSSWLGWFDGDIPKKAQILHSNWFWWRLYEAWIAEDEKRKTVQVTRQQLMTWVMPSIQKARSINKSVDSLSVLFTTACAIKSKQKEIDELYEIYNTLKKNKAPEKEKLAIINKIIVLEEC